MSAVTPVGRVEKLGVENPLDGTSKQRLKSNADLQPLVVCADLTVSSTEAHQPKTDARNTGVANFSQKTGHGVEGMRGSVHSQTYFLYTVKLRGMVERGGSSVKVFVMDNLSNVCRLGRLPFN